MVKSYRIFTGAPKLSLKDALSSEAAVNEAESGWYLTCADGQSQSYHQNATFEDESEVTKSLNNKSGYKSLFHQQNTTLPFLRADDRTFNRTYDSYEGSTMLSEGSSISRFPTFNFNLDHVTSLSSLISAIPNQKHQFMKVNLLVSILEVDGPAYVTSKNKNNSEEMALLKLVIGDDGGQICKLIVWRDTAELWSGLSSNNSTMKRGDVVYFENIVFNGAATPRDASFIELTASPSHKSAAQICYRTATTAKEDMAFRPDLRLASSIPCVRRVSEIVAWLQFAGYT